MGLSEHSYWLRSIARQMTLELLFIIYEIKHSESCNEKFAFLEVSVFICDCWSESTVTFTVPVREFSLARRVDQMIQVEQLDQATCP